MQRERKENDASEEKDGPRRAVNRVRNSRSTCLGITFILLFYCGVAFTGVMFMFMDTIQNGIIYYQYETTENSNKISCGYQIIKLHCSDYETDICWEGTTDDIYIHRKDVAASYNESYALIYYICTCIGCIVPYVLLSLLWVCKADVNAPVCGIKTKYICSVLCSMSLVVSLMAVSFGVTLTNCSNGLEHYINGSIYDDVKINGIDVYWGETVVFMMITSGITLFFTAWCIQCSIRGSRITTRTHREWTMMFEGKKDDTLRTHYGSANTELRSFNVMDEGFN